MSDPYAAHGTDLTRLHQFILEHFDREDLRTLSFDLSVDYDSLPAEGKAAKARELILALGHRHHLDRLLDGLWQARPGPFAQTGLNSDPRTIASLETQLSAFGQAHVARQQDQRPLFSPPALTYIEPGRPKRRRAIAIVVILTAVGSLVLSILTQPWSSPQPGTTPFPLSSLLWLGQICVSLIVILASMAQIFGLNVRELFSSRPAGVSAEAFPFHVVRDFDELLDHLFPDPTVPFLPDRSIAFLPRISGELDTAFHRCGRVLIRGRRKTGKTREAIELLRRWWHTGPTILLAKDHVGLYPPYRIPDTLTTRNLVLLFDDVDRYCGDADAVKRLDQTIAFFAGLCRDPGELRVIATARQEPEFWDRLHYDEATPPWATFKMLSLSELSSDSARRLIQYLAHNCGMGVDPAAAEDMAIKNDGTFLNLVLSFRGWLHEGIRRIGSEQAAAFEGNLVTTWRRRYERMVEALPEAGPIYATADLLQTLRVPLRPALVTDLATEMNLSRAYHLTQGLFHWISQELPLSPQLNWYRNPRRRRRVLALGVLVALLIFYTLFYTLYCIVPASLSTAFFNRLADELWLQLLFFSPLLISLAPPALSFLLRQHRRRKHRHVQSALNRLLATEIPLRGDELHPYEGQFDGNGTSRAWHPAVFAGYGGTAAFKRMAAPRLAAIHWTWAEELRAAGELEPARSLARLASVLAPNHPTPPFVLGRLWHDAGDFRRALTEFARSRALNPTTSVALTLERIAWCFYHLEEYERAESAAGQALILMPGLTAARWVQGLARLQRGQGDVGLSNCRQAALAEEAPPLDLGPALASALTSRESRSWAVQVSRLLRRDTPHKTRQTALWRRVKWILAVGLALASVLVFLLGIPYVSRNLEENAGLSIQTMGILLRLYPHAPVLLAQRGYAYDRLNDYEQAIVDFTEAIRLDPKYAVAYNGRGNACAELGDYERAIADYTEAIRLDPDYAVAYNNRGYAYDELGDYERAIADYTEAIRLDPDDAVIYRNRGNTYNRLKDYEQAIVDFTEAIRLDPDDAVVYKNRGNAYYELRDYERAIADYTEAIRIDPDYVVAYNNRGYAYNELGDYERAIADYTEAIRIDPDYTVAYNNRGYAYRNLGDYERAIADYTEAIRVDPDYALAYANRGWAYKAQGDLIATRADWERAIELYEAREQPDAAERVRSWLSSLGN